MHAVNLKARIGIDDDTKEHFVEISVRDLTGKVLGPPWTFGPYKTKDCAELAMVGLVETAIESLKDFYGLPVEVVDKKAMH